MYNERNDVRDSIASFLSQTYANHCELICIDDGSTDGTVEIIHDFISQFPDRIRLLQQKHVGSGEARNLGMQNARGAYIGFLDADDRYPDNTTLERLILAAQATSADVVGGSLESVLVDSNGNEKTAKVAKMYVFDSEGWVAYSDYQVDFAYQRFIFKTNLIKDGNITFPSYLRYQDPPFFVKAMISAGRFYALPYPTYHYRLSEKKVSWNHDKAFDLLDGIAEVGTMAAEAGLLRLVSLNQNRLRDNWNQVLKDLIRDTFDFELFLKTIETARAIKQQGLSLCATFSENCFYDDLTSDVLEKLESLPTNRPTETGSESYERTILELREDIYRLKQSNSWKIGRMVTSIPRAIKRTVKRKS